MMKEVHNFNAGPCILPDAAVEAGIEALKNFSGTGMAVVEVSHRSKEWKAVMAQCNALWRELLGIPDNYKILFLGGGASMQFCMVPFNLLQKKAAYLETGVWAKKAQQEAKGFGEVATVASSADKNFSYIPKNYIVPADADYFHITTNNTIYGTELKIDIDSPVPLVADMSSDIMSRKVDISKYALIYGGAQKNVGTAGVSFVIVREDVLGKTSRYIPSILNYRTHINGEDGMFNTPPVFPIYIMAQTLQWLKSIGGVDAIHKINIEKAQMLYDEIDRNPLFTGTAAKDDRSIMNICFIIKEEFKDKETAFLEFAKSKNIVGIKGHRLVGGFRASTYNALPKESVLALINCMQEFENEK